MSDGHIAGELVAGRELDARIAVEVMGFVGVGYYGPQGPHTAHHEYDRFDTWEEAMERFRLHWPESSWPRGCDPCHWREGWGPLYVGDYSTEISEAMGVLDQLGGIVTITRIEPDNWHVTIGLVTCWADTLPLAICRAALACTALPRDASVQPLPIEGP